MKNPKISDLLDTLQAPDLPLEPDQTCSADRIKAATLAKIQAAQLQTAPAAHGGSSKPCFWAAALVLALSVSALAAGGPAPPGDLVRSFFRHRAGRPLGGRCRV